MIRVRNILRRRAGVTLVELSVCLLVIAILAVFSFAPSHTGKIMDDGLKDQGILIDTALSQWYSFHRSYPADLDVLVNNGGLTEKIVSAKMNYTVNASQTAYRLTVTLAKDEWVTPGSKY